MGYKAVLENEICSQISGWRWQPLGWVRASISSVRIQRRMERTLLVLAVLEVLGSGVCSPQPVHLQGWALGMGRELSSVCSPALFSLLAFHTPLGFKRWSSLLPPGIAVNSRWLLLHSKCYMRHHSMSAGGWLGAWVVNLPSFSAWLVWQECHEHLCCRIGLFTSLKNIHAFFFFSLCFHLFFLCSSSTCVLRDCVFMWKKVLWFFWYTFFSLATALKQMLQKELLKSGSGHLLPCGTHYLEIKAFICPILPFREHSVYIVLDYLKIDYPTELVSGITRHIWLNGYNFGDWLRWGTNRNNFNKSWHWRRSNMKLCVQFISSLLV